MEVKIKIGGEIIDAKIVMMNGDMIVSPKAEKYEPKDGDVFCVYSLHPCVGIVKEEYSYGKPDKDRLYFSVGYWKQSGNMQFGTFCACNRNTEPNYRPATEEEKQKLFDRLKEEGWEWDAEKKELVKLKWKPESGDIFYRPSSTYGRFDCYKTSCNHSGIDKTYISKGWCFRTKEECESFCKKLNDCISSINS